MAILDTDLLLVNRPGDDATYKTTFATLKDNLPAGTIVSENPPGEDVVEQGLLWFDSSIASLFIWYDDGDTAQWVDVYAGAVSGLEIPPPVTVGANPPSGAVEGDLWWDTNKGELYVYYIDSDSEQWVAASPGGIYDGDGSGGGGATVIVGETAPTTRPDGTDLVEGDLWWNNDSTENGGGRMFVYYSNNWVDTSLPGGPGGGEGGSGDGASVSVGEVPPTGSSQGDLWWCSRSIDEGGGRLYIYYEGQWIDASIPGGGGGGGDFSQAEADTLYLSKAAAGDTAAGAITFESATTHEGGVSVTGGDVVLSSGGQFIASTLGTGLGAVDSNGTQQKHNGRFVSYASYTAANFGPLYEFYQTKGAVSRQFAVGLSSGKPYVFTDGNNPTSDPSTIALGVSPEVEFDQLTTHEGGVEVTGGSGGAVSRGLYSGNSKTLAVTAPEEINFYIDGTSQAAVDSLGRIVSRSNNSIVNDTLLVAGFSKSIYNYVTGGSYGGNSGETIDGNTVGVSYATSMSSTVAIGAAVGYFARVADVGPGNIETAYGFYSELQEASALTNVNETYNFYAASGAPNFLKGDTYIGGTTARNTRELWESALTEEQKEQLTAGTLVIPANVSLPGDGSFARQWWYDQQSVEDQALIDNGELEYPSHFQAANFVDTFDLGDNTAINLTSDGYVYQTGIQWKGSGNSTLINSKGFFNSFSRGTVVAVNSTKTAGEQVRGLVTRVDTVKDDDDNPIDAGDAHVYVAETPLNSANGKVNDWIGFSCNAPNDTFSTTAIKGNPYGFYSNINAGNGYNFYAEGNAPNYFKSGVRCGGNPNLGGNDLLDTTSENGVVISQTTQVFARCGDSSSNPSVWLNRISTGGKPKYINFAVGSGSGSVTVLGFIRQNNTSASATGIQYCVDNSGTPAFVEIGDARNRSFTDFSGNAADKIKLLQPKVNGFNPAQLQAVVANAVTGTENEEEAIGSLADYDGTVLETEVAEPDELEYTEEVETDGVATMVTRTRTWTPSGTRPVYQGVDQTKLIPLLTKALQEALDRIETLEADVATLQGN